MTLTLKVIIDLNHMGLTFQQLSMWGLLAQGMDLKGLKTCSTTFRDRKNGVQNKT